MQFLKGKGQTAFMWGIGIYAILLSVFSITAHYSNTKSFEDTYKDLIKKKEILSQIRINLLKSVEMEKDAVMALTDEESQDFADQSTVASSAVEQNLRLLHTLTDASHLQDEKKLIAEFDSCWMELHKLDKTILELAVQNTNLKASALSREKGAEAMERFEHALKEIGQSYTDIPNEGRVEKSIGNALTNGLKIYNLHSPHIAESSDEKMDKIEAEMKAEENDVLKSFDELSGITGEEHRESLSKAKKAFSDFMDVTTMVIKLSRQNSNIKSLEISLGRKRKVTAQCDEVLAAFQETVQSRNFKATK
jgi:hypothetical protein